MLGDANAVRARGVQHENAALTSGIQVNVIDPGTGSRDHLEVRGGGQQISIHLGAAADDQALRVPQVTEQLVPWPSGTGIHLPALPTQQVGGGIGQRIGDDDLWRSWCGLGCN